MKYEEYAGREGDIVTGIIQQTDARYTLLDLGRVEAPLPQAEQVPYERYEPRRPHEGVHRRGPQDRQGPADRRQPHPPRPRQAAVRARGARRSPTASSRSRRAPASRVTARRSRSRRTTTTSTRSAPASARAARASRMVVNELRGEKVDIVPFSADAPDFVMQALAPAKVREVRLHDRHGHRRGDRPRLPALARDRQGRPERAARGAAHRLARRHQERDASSRKRSRAAA